MVDSNLELNKVDHKVVIQKELRLRIALIVLFLGYVLATFHRFSLAILADRLSIDLHLNITQLSALTAVYFYPYAFMQFPVGIIVDRIGPKRLVSSMLILAAISSLAFATVNSFPLALGMRLLIGLSVSCIFVPTEKFIASYFPPERFSTLTSYLFFAGISGALFASAPLAYLVNYLGWRQVYIIMGAVAGVLGIATLLLLNNVQTPNQSPDLHASVSLRSSLKEVLREWGLWPVVIRNFLGYGSSATFQSLWAGPFLISIVGVDRISAGYLIMLLSLAQLAILPFGGLLSDKVFRSRKIPLMISCIGLVLFWSVFAFFPSKLSPFNVAFLFTFNALLAGLSSGPVFTQIKELYPLEVAGTALGIGNFFNMAGPAVIPLIVGAAMASKVPSSGTLTLEAFTLGFRYLFAASVIAAIAYAFSKDTSPQSDKAQHVEVEEL